MLRKLLTLIFISGLVVPSAFAQTGSITGTVTNQETGNTIIGANVYIQSNQRGASTNADGRYTIENLDVGTYTIRVSFIGYKTIKQNVEVNKGENTVNFVLKPSSQSLNNVIVTAQQIKRQRREITTSITSVSGEDITKAQSDNLVNDLSGKVPGVQVTSQSGTAGGSSRITIRGDSKLSGNTQPLFVVDGVPIYNSNIAGATSSRLSGGAVDVGNRASDINPDDIANISVLRGASAAALYGQRAQNGVILITTKKGSQKGETKVSINSSIRTNRPLRLPNFQNEYAQGNDGEYVYDNTNGWGPKITGQEVPQFPFNKEETDDNPNGGTIKPLKAYPDNVRNFLRNGIEAINNISVAGGNTEGGGDFRLSLTNTRNKGIIPGNTFHRNNIALNAGKEFNDHLNARATANYINSTAKGRPIQGGNSPNSAYGSVFRLPRTTSTKLLKKKVTDEEGDQIPLIPNEANNPYFITQNNGLDNTVQRFIGSGHVAYSPLKWLTLSTRVGIDFYSDDRQRPEATGTIGALDGSYSVDRISQQQIDGNVLLSVTKQLNSDFHLDASLGGNLNTRQFQRFSNNSQQLIVKDLFTFGNANSNTPTQGFTQQRLLGAYFDATVGFRDYLFLHLTGRNDISSTLPDNNNSYFYPSASLGYVFTDGLNIDSNILSYGKVRASLAEVGSDEAPYQLNFRYFPVSTVFGQFGEDLNLPFNGARAFNATGTNPPSDLKPQEQVSYEFGTELGFFNSRLNVNFTYYHNETRDQIISIPVPQSTGFNANRTNAGTLLNKGIEASLNITPIEGTNFQWNSQFSFTRNIQTIETLAEGVDQYIIDTGFNGLRIEARPGKSLGLYATGFKKNDNGKYIINPTNGLRQTGGEIRLGSQNPLYQLGITNTFNYKNLSLNFLIDISKGGTVVSETARAIRSLGLAQETADLRDQYPDGNYIQDGVIENDDGSFSKNDVPVNSIQAYYQNLYNASNFAESSYDASYVKLREINLGYSLPKRWFKNSQFNDVTISFVGRNLWLIYSGTPDIDPETNVFGSADIAKGVEFNNIPSVKSFGGKIHISF